MVVALRLGFHLDLELFTNLPVTDVSTSRIKIVMVWSLLTRVQSGRDHESRKTDQNNCNAKQQRSGTT
jgi:hypothetical protein